MLRFLLLLMMLVTMTGCRTLGYYTQAVTGHLDLLLQRQPVDALLDDPSVDAETRASLTLAMAAREFARERLALDPDGSYRHYVALDRDYVVWNVFAAPAFSLDPLQWCYPVAGCVSYRGYFDEADARQEARRLAGEGYDVYVGGVGAYSTLGWFDDPLTTPMIERSPYQLVAMMFHELAHQRVYARGDTDFNESYATFVERQGLRQWSDTRDEPVVYRRYRMAQQRHAEFVALVLEHVEKLRRLYTSVDEEAVLLQGKSEIQSQLRENYEILQQCWGVDAYRSWFAGPLNNAQLSTVSSYNAWVPAFERLMRDQDGDWQAFHEAVAELAQLEPEDRRAALLQLQERADAGAGITAPATPCVPGYP